VFKVNTENEWPGNEDEPSNTNYTRTNGTHQGWIAINMHVDVDDADAPTLGQECYHAGRPCWETTLGDQR
jgi:hypothetical protein